MSTQHAGPLYRGCEQSGSLYADAEFKQILIMSLPPGGKATLFGGLVGRIKAGRPFLSSIQPIS